MSTEANLPPTKEDLIKNTTKKNNNNFDIVFTSSLTSISFSKKKTSILVLGSEAYDDDINAASMKRNKSFMRCKTKSRLIDTDKVDRRSGRVARSGQLKSGYLGRINDEEEEDPFADGDLPDEYRKAKFSTLTII